MSPDYDRALALLNSGRAREARDLLQRALTRDPASPHLQNLMARACLQLGEPQRAVYFMERVVSARPDDPASLANLGNALAAAGALDRAEEVLRKALTLDPSSPPVRHALWDVLMERRRVGAAARLAREGLALRPGDPMLTIDLATADAALARAEESVAALRELSPRHPDLRLLHQSLAFYLNYAPGVEPGEIADAHRRYAEIVRRLYPDDWRDTIDRDPDRRLRVGIMSSDLRTHSVAYFARPIFEHLDRTAFEVVAFSLGAPPDDPMTRALRAASDRWHDVGNLPNDDLLARIRGERIDILIELNGLTRGGRLAAIIRRAAPIQITMIGYPATTGWPTIDYRVVDSLTDPSGADAYASERLIRLDPCFLCYHPPDNPPDPDARERTPGVVFGSFNDIAKINSRVIDTWAALLQRVPGSTLFLKSHALLDTTIADDLAARFHAAGVARERLRLEAWAPDLHSHLALYRHVDVALDTFPYCGTTTTCEALLMGVPVVTLADPRPLHASRVGLSLLSAVGLSDLVASDPASYIDLAARLAADESRRREYRAALRDRLLQSVLCDRPAYARRLGEALRRVWRDRCAGSRA
jgi:predicted O-linked N-acetylglucosamine transferase (SPINDLY family)